MVKKLIVISILFAAMVALGVFELSYDRKNFSELSESLSSLSEVIEQNEDDVSVVEVRLAYAQADKKWRSMNNIVMALTNHNVVRAINEKFAYLEKFIEANVHSDALSTTEALIEVCDNLCDEKRPQIGNIF